MSIVFGSLAGLGIAMAVLGLYLPRTAPSPVRARIGAFCRENQDAGGVWS